MQVDFFLKKLKENELFVPSLHVVLGSGLSNVFSSVELSSEWQTSFELPFKDFPGGLESTAPGHKGLYRFFKHKSTSKTLCIQIGRLHGYEGIDPWVAIQPIVVSARAGCPRFLLSNAAGGISSKFKEGSIMLIRDHVNLTGQNPLYGPNHKDEKGQPLGPRFQDMTQVYSPQLNERLAAVLKKNLFDVHFGVYLGLGGPTYETPAEVQLFARWGMDAVGMSTVWEATALKYLSKEVFGFSFISNLAAGISPHPLSHTEVEEIAARSGKKIIESIFEAAPSLWS